MESVGADGYWMLHNHPSGNVQSSSADTALTGRLGQEVPGFKGHVIINHNKYSVSLPGEDGEFTEHQHTFKEGTDRLKDNIIPHEVLGTVVTSADALVQICKKIEAAPDSMAVLIFQGGSKSGIRAIVEIPKGLSEKRLSATVRKYSLQTGGQQAFMVLPSGEAIQPWSNGVRLGFLTDVLNMDGESLGHRKDDPSSFFGQALSGTVVDSHMPLAKSHMRTFKPLRLLKPAMVTDYPASLPR